MLVSNEEREQQIEVALKLARSGNRAEARRIVEKIIEQDDANEQAWMILAGLVDTPRDRRICLENVLEINPNNERARQALAQLKPSPPSTTSLPSPAARVAATTPPPRPAQGKVKLPTTRMGETTPGTAQAWRNQRRGNQINSTFITVAALSFVLMGIGAFILFGGTSDPTGLPTLTPSATSAIAAAATQTALSRPPTRTPTVELRGTIVQFVPNRTLIPPTWTPSITPTALPTFTPRPTLPPLTSYTLAFTAAGRGRPVSGIYTARGDGSGERLLIDIPDEASGPVYSPDGARIAFTVKVEGREQIGIANADGSNVTVITGMLGQKARSLTWSPDGTQIAFTSDDNLQDDLYIVNVNTRQVTRLTDSERVEIDPAWSPDGTKLLYAADPTGRGALQIFVRDFTKEGNAAVTQLTNSQGSNYQPSWSPDGSAIVFISTRTRTPRVYVMRSSGDDERPLIVEDVPSENRHPVYSPDGRYIAFTSTRNGGVENLFIVTADGRDLQQITNQPGGSSSATFRPDR